MKNQRGNLGKKILLVEDEPSVSRSIKMLLTYDGFEVHLAECAEDALVLYGGDDFDVVITDFSMPGMTGGELAARIKKLNPSQPIILATASIYKLDQAKNPARTVDYILNKPFGLQELREAIASVHRPRDSD